MNVMGRFVRWMLGARRQRLEQAAKYYGVSAVDEVPDRQTNQTSPAPADAQIEELRKEVKRLKKQIRAERIADRGGKPATDAVRLSALPIGDVTRRDLGSGDGFTLGIVGESYRQGALHELAGDHLRRGEHVTFIVALIPEPENTHDVNAIRVDIQGGPQVGYLSRDDAIRYHAVFQWLTARKLTGVARAKLIGGVEGKPSIGVILDMLDSSDLLARLAPQEQAF